MIEFGAVDFWTVHGWGFILAMCFFPRAALLFGTAPGALFWWLGFFFAPRIMVAAIATIKYGETNPALVIFTWLWAAVAEEIDKNQLTKCRDREEK